MLRFCKSDTEFYICQYYHTKFYNPMYLTFNRICDRIWILNVMFKAVEKKQLYKNEL